MPFFIKKGGGPDAKKWLLLAVLAYVFLVLLASCGCPQTIDGMCVEGSVNAEDVRSAIASVRNECSLPVADSLTIRFLKDPPDQDCGLVSGCTPIAGQYDPEEKAALVWGSYEFPYAVLRHELIHAALDTLHRDMDAGHIDPGLWCHVNQVDSCEAKAALAEGVDCWGKDSPAKD